MLPRTAGTDPQPLDLRQCAGGGGPQVFFDYDDGALDEHGDDGARARARANATLGGPLPPANASASVSAPAFVLSALSHFTSNLVRNCAFSSDDRDWAECHLGVSARAGGCGAQGARCQLFNTTSVMLARPGVTRVTRAFGALLRRAHNTTRARGAGVNALSYWNDNQAGYSRWSVVGDEAEAPLSLSAGGLLVVVGRERPGGVGQAGGHLPCLLYTSPSPRDRQKSRMPSSA